MLTSLKEINKNFTSLPSTTKFNEFSHSYFDNNIGKPVHNSPASKEWFNNVYGYNKNYVKTLPLTDRLVNRLIKSYFNLDKLKNQKKSKQIQVRFKRLSLNRILVSRAEINHTSDKATIYVYLYNRNKKIFLYKLKKLYKTLFFKKVSTLKKISSVKKKSNKTLVNKLLVNNSKMKHMPIKNKHSSFAGKSKIRVFSSRRFKNSNITRKVRKAYSKLFSDLKMLSINKLIYSLSNVSRKSKLLLRKRYLSISLPKPLNYLMYFVKIPKSSLNVIKNKRTPFLHEKSKLHNILENKKLFFTTKVNKKRDFRSYENIFTENALKSVNKSKKHFLLYKLTKLHRLILASYRFNNKNALSESVYLKSLVGLSIPKILKKSNSSLLLSFTQKTKLIKKINLTTLKSLRILKKVRKHKRFLLKVLK